MNKERYGKGNAREGEEDGKAGTETERERKRKRAAHTVHMRDRPSAYEAAGIDQPKSATTPGVLLRALLFSARRGAKQTGEGARGREFVRRAAPHRATPFVGGG